MQTLFFTSEIKELTHLKVRNNNMKTKRLLSAIFCIILALALICGCTPKEKSTGSVQKTFTLEVVYEDGQAEEIELTSTEKYVGAALIKEKIIEGEDGKYGMYIKSVNGVVADFNKTGTYWAFYIDGEYATTGVDKTEIKAGAKYSLKVEK